MSRVLESLLTNSTRVPCDTESCLGLTPDDEIVIVMAEFDPPPDPDDPEGEEGEPQLASATPASATEAIHPVKRSKNLPPTKS